MKTGDWVIMPPGNQLAEPRMFEVQTLTRGKATLRSVNTATGVLGDPQQQDVYTVRSWRLIPPNQKEDMRRLILDLHRQYAATRDFVRSLPMVADSP